MHHRITKTWDQEYADLQRREERLAHVITDYVGSWKFIKVQSFFIFAWIVGNIITTSYQYGLHGFNFHSWDPYPFILLNLVFSFQSAYTAPFILMDSKYNVLRDRHVAENTQLEVEEIRYMLRRIERHLKIEEDRG